MEAGKVSSEAAADPSTSVNVAADGDVMTEEHTAPVESAASEGIEAPSPDLGAPLARVWHDLGIDDD